MTVDQATERAKEMWASAPDSVKEKYSKRAGEGRLSPSERRQAADRQQDGASQQRRFTNRALAVPDGQGGVAPVGGEAEDEEGFDDEVGAAPADNGNMDAEVAAMTTPAMRDEMAAQLGMGEDLAMAGAGMGLHNYSDSSMDAGAMNKRSAQTLDKRLAESGSVTPAEIEEKNKKQQEEQARKVAKDAEVRAAAEARRVASQRERAGLPAQQAQPPKEVATEGGSLPSEVANQPTENGSPSRNAIVASGNKPKPRPTQPQQGSGVVNIPHDPQESPVIQRPRPSDEAYKAGYLGKNAEARYQADMAKGAVPSQEPRMPSMGNNPREVSAYRAEMAMRPGMQRQIAQQSGVQRQTAPPTAADNARGQAAQDLAERQRNPGISMAEVEGLGQMAAWGVNPQTGQQLTRGDLAGLREQRGLNPAGQIDQPRMAAQISQSRRRPAGSRR
jgi:hypothetical protein